MNKLFAAALAATLSCGAWAQVNSAGSSSGAPGTGGTGSYGTQTQDNTTWGTSTSGTGSYSGSTSTSGTTYVPYDNSSAAYTASGRVTSSAPDRSGGVKRHNAAGGLPAGEMSTPYQDGGGSFGYEMNVK